jgi:hypothetical protein
MAASDYRAAACPCVLGPPAARRRASASLETRGLASDLPDHRLGQLASLVDAVAVERLVVCMLRLKKMCTSHSQVKPMPPCSCTERSEMNAPASDASLFAMRAALSASSGSPTSMAQAVL